MNINTNSWHYRWLQFWHFAIPKTPILWQREGSMMTTSSQPNSLCGYVTSMWAVPALTIVMLSLAVIVTVVAGPVLTIFLPIKWVVMKARRIRNRDNIGQLKQPNIALEYIKARKQGICPIITYTDGDPS